LNEHWLDKDTINSFYVKDYCLVNFFARKNKAYGGSLILVRDYLKPHAKKMRIKSVENKFEICGATLEINNSKITLISLYRPSNKKANGDMSGFFDLLEDFLEKHRGTNDIILAGDLNVDLLEETANSRHLINIFDTYNMKLINTNKITRKNVTNENRGTLIDHIFTSIQKNNTFNVLEYDTSDHHAVTSTIDVPICKPRDFHKQVRQFSEKNWSTFKDLLIKENWQPVYDLPSTDEKSEYFMNKIVQYFNISFPLKKIVIRANQTNKINLSASTRQLRNRLLTISNDIQSTPCAIEKERLKRERAILRKQVSQKIRLEIKVKNDSKISKSKNKSTTAWKIFKDLIGKTKFQHDISSLNVNGKVENIKFNIANTLNQTFIVQPPANPPPTCDYNLDQPVCDVPFALEPTNEAEIYSIICKLSPKKSSGWDEISVETLKRISLFILKPLCHLVNSSFASGNFPKNMKISKVIPIFKKGEKEDAANYRPIAITSAFSKVYEKAFLARLQKHFDSNNIINQTQHGFQKNKSTVTALFDFATQIYSSIDARERVNVILYDFSNAFGTLYPALLLQKLKIYGVNDEAISWLHCFLTQREQYVQIRDVDCDGTEITINSERLTSDMGVPQGTILGPTSFISYSNDMPLRIIIAILILYADDSTIIAKGKTLLEANANAIKSNTEIVKFADENHLHLNASKTKVMQIHTHYTQHIDYPELVINDTDVEAANECKLLGALISDTMNWLPQCEKVSNKLRSVTYMFTILRDAVSEISLRLIYYAYAQSQILYSIVIWGGSPHIQKVFVAQKRVVRAMAGLRYWRSNCALESCRPLFAEYGILTVYSLYILECMKFFANNPEKFRRKCDVPNSKSPKTRNGKMNHCINDLHVEIDNHLQILNQNPIVMIARIFNNLPVPIKMMEDKKAFISKIKEIVWHHQFYDMDEFFVCNFE
jgi:Reverse transcriptase (RNA-dependent DNA polymerase)/Endonuclease-reverse transcriptase